MQIVLNKDVKKLGYKGDVVDVRPGYFRNFLFPNGFADVATISRLKVAADRKEKMTLKKEQVLENSADVIKKLSGLVINLEEKVNDKGHLYASVTESEIVSEVEKSANITLDPKFVKMDHIKELGDHKVLVDLGSDMTVEISLVIKKA